MKWAQECVAELLEEPWDKGKGRPRGLTFREALIVACGYARNNITEEIWAEIFDVGQSTISRYITFLTPLIDQATAGFRPSAEEAAEATRGAIALGRHQRVHEHDRRRPRLAEPGHLVHAPIGYALASDTLIGVVRARHQDLDAVLAPGETTPLAAAGGLVLWLLRRALAPESRIWLSSVASTRSRRLTRWARRLPRPARSGPCAARATPAQAARSSGKYRGCRACDHSPSEARWAL